MKKNDFKEFTEKMISSMNVDEVQKTVMTNMLSGVIDNMTDKDLNQVKTEVTEFLEKQNQKVSVFD